MSFLQSLSCRVVDLLHPRKEDYHIGEIANSLSKLCRFTGQIPYLYTVAQHSVLCAEVALYQDNLSLDSVRWALLHDAAESFLGDVSSPLKSLLPEYRQLEAKHLRAMASRFGMSEGIPHAVKNIDRRMLVTERDMFYSHVTKVWDDWSDVEPYRDMELRIWNQDEAYDRFRELAYRFRLG